MKWWSESRKTWTTLGEMPDMHLLNAWRKLLRKEYLVPTVVEGVNEAVPRALALMEEVALRGLFEAEFKRRELDPQYANGKPPEVTT